MSGLSVYLDASAFVKLTTEEPESQTLEAFLGSAPLASSALLRTEARRAVRHLGIEALEHAAASLSTVTLIDISDGILDRAGMLDPPVLRSLDAIHVSTALTLGEDLDVVVTYDARMLRAAAALDLPVESPA